MLALLLQQLSFNEALVALDEALQRLTEMDERAAKVVELRDFGGLTEAAEALNISPATLKRDWKFARTWLVSQLRWSHLTMTKRCSTSAFVAVG
ncbi:MAG: hypothetical protein DMG13_06920 [Acidobacteria bacterium]|nr:MAG: hypothetical protein DMG13_06920 [Acidobacteriota bacterium]